MARAWPDFATWPTSDRTRCRHAEDVGYLFVNGMQFNCEGKVTEAWPGTLLKRGGLWVSQAPVFWFFIHEQSSRR